MELSRAQVRAVLPIRKVMNASVQLHRCAAETRLRAVSGLYRYSPIQCASGASVKHGTRWFVRAGHGFRGVSAAYCACLWGWTARAAPSCHATLPLSMP